MVWFLLNSPATVHWKYNTLKENWCIDFDGWWDKGRWQNLRLCKILSWICLRNSKLVQTGCRIWIPWNLNIIQFYNYKTFLMIFYVFIYLFSLILILVKIYTKYVIFTIIIDGINNIFYLFKLYIHQGPRWKNSIFHNSLNYPKLK